MNVDHTSNLVKFFNPFRFHAVALSLIVGLSVLSADTRAAQIDQKTRDSSVEAIAQLLHDRYAIESVGAGYAALLRSNLVAGRYATITEGGTLARRITADLQSLHPDRHLGVRFSPEPLPKQENNWTPSPEQVAYMRLREKRTNSGFEKVEILPGNIGYISFTHFGDPGAGAAKMSASMQFVADTEALIIDLRRNGGATHLALMDLLTRYLVEDSKIVTAKTKWRGDAPDFIKNPIILPTTAPRYLDRPVYLLTSKRTFSGAEGFAYNLQAMKRVTIVGERTGGGANPGGELRACDHFAVWVPAGIVEHPITKTNWEGTGIIPEIEVDVDRAHLHAHTTAIYTAIQKAGDDHHWRKHLAEQKSKVEKQLAHREPTTSVEFKLAGYADAKRVTVYGSFNDWSGEKADMKRKGDHWKATVELPVGRHSYKFRIDDEWITDPTNPTMETTADGHTNSVIDVSK
jgi:hypothetical protein